MNIIRNVSRLLTGLVFIYSGFVKGIDPLGSVYKFNDYFATAGVGFLEPLSLLLAVLLCTAEFIIGISLFLGLRMKLSAWALLIFMSFFTLLTFIIAIFNPVSDCGCFGDALIITNWQTFWKNVTLMIPTIIVFIEKDKFRAIYKDFGEWAILAIITFAFLFVMHYSYRHLPFVDFRPYSIGSDIKKAMEIPDDAPVDEYKTYLYYEKDGMIKEFTMDDYPWQDTTWKWVETKNVLVKEGYVPPIDNFVIETLDGFDITYDVINDPGYSFLLVSYDLNKVGKKAFHKANEIASFCNRGNCKFYCLTASPFSEIESFKNKFGPEFEFYQVDEITLKTIIRANPGLVLLNKGTVVGKWHNNDIPEVGKLKDNLLSTVLTEYRKNTEKSTVIIISLVLILFLSIVRHIQKSFDNRK